MRNLSGNPGPRGSHSGLCSQADLGIIPSPPQAAMGQSEDPRTPRGSGPVHAVPIVPQDVRGSFRAAAGLRALTFGLAFSPPPATAAPRALFGILRGRGGLGCLRSPSRLHQFPAVLARGPIPAARPCPEGQSSLHTAVGPPNHPIPGLLFCGLRPLTNPGLPPLPCSAPTARI
ncbi:hypothetical protein P7K49_034495 [Saguinus oedipus]|uniref:Uncharacterized protein n=1 Tax=Saguinus oedipus TaxID=9490 RepID=A0ABQ9TUY2_SAGOE|nr:hypothetical protein P7K49_034495 [Saguinus oedipus]